MTITVNTPDGGTASFPDDTSKDDIVSAMKAKFGGPDDSKPDEGGVLTTAANVAKSLSDTITFGAGDYTRSLATGEDVGKLQESSKKAHEDLGAWDVPVTMAGYAIGPGKFGAAERIGADLVGRGVGRSWAHGAGAAAEGAGATALGDIGHGETPGMDVVTGGALAAPFGAAVGGRGRALGPAIERATSKPKLTDAIEDFRGPETPPPKTVPEAVLQANKDRNYQTLEATPVKARDAGQAFNQALGSLSPGEQASLSDTLKGRISNISDLLDNSPKLTLGDLHAFSTSIATGMRSPGDRIAGARLAEAFNSLDPQGLMGKARLSQGQLADTQKLTKGMSDVGWFGDPSKVIKQAGSDTAGGRMNYSPAGREAMEKLAQSGPSQFNEMVRNLTAMGVNHGVSAGMGALGGGALGHATLGAIIGATQGTGKADVGKAAVQWYTNKAARRAMKAAIAATSSGLKATPDMYRKAPWLSQGGRQAVYGEEAANR